MSVHIHDKLELIDYKLFVPLNHFLQCSPFDPVSAEQFVLSRGKPGKKNSSVEQYIGFLWEVYLKDSLKKFGDTVKYRFVPCQPPTQPFNGHKASVTNFDNVFIYNGDNSTAAEIDALFTYQEKDGPIPIIFEISISESQKNEKNKEDLVTQMFEKQPYYCRIYPTRKRAYNILGLYKNSDYRRKIDISDSPEVRYLAKKMWQDAHARKSAHMPSDEKTI